MARLATVLILLASLAAGCSTMEVAVDYDRERNFSGLSTFDWIPDPQTPTGDPRIDDNTLLDRRIRRAVESELMAKGFAKSAESPDFWLAYHVTLDRRQSVSTINRRYGYGPGWGWTARGEPYATRQRADPFVFEYDEGSLLLDVVDPEGRDLIWRGAATDEVSFSASPAAREQQINEAVRRMLKKFPPK